MIKLIVGLANPGERYAETRHNAGAWLVESLARQANVSFKVQTKFHSRMATLEGPMGEVKLAIPTTYMNENGLAVRTICNFYKIDPKSVLIIHDDLDLCPGDIRLKLGGGHGGHNGLRSLIQTLSSKDFIRLRIGIGHPGIKDGVTDYVLKKPKKHEHEAIANAQTSALALMPQMLAGKYQLAMNTLHTATSKD